MDTTVAATPYEVPGYAKASGIIALILAIVGFIVPVFGVLFIIPIAILLGCVALYGGYKGIGIAVLVIAAVKLIISPTFWLNIGAGTLDGGGANQLITYVNVIGIVVMVYLAARKVPARR
jgi:hypothetical protein